VNQVLDELLLDEVVEFSRITGKPVHELLGITKEQLEEWLDKCESERKTMSGNDKCGKCDSGTIQHTSFMNDDGVSITHVYGCNRCDNGWSEEENPPHTVQKELQEDEKP
jgi:hypothetical protein